MRKIIIFAVSFLTLFLFGSLPGQGKVFSFIQISDVQICFLGDSQSFTSDSLNFEKVVEQINRLRPAFVIDTGDMIHLADDAEQLQCYKTIAAKIDKSIPVWQLPGNHDIGGEMTDEDIQRYIDRYGYQNFKFKYKGCLFVGINSNSIRYDNIAQAEAQYSWLENTLSTGKAKMKFVFSHHPFFIKSFTEEATYSNQPQEVREKYWDLFSDTGVAAVGAGHEHYQSEAEHNGIGMHIAGPVGFPLGDGETGVYLWTVDTKAKTYLCKFLTIEELSELDQIP